MITLVTDLIAAAAFVQLVIFSLFILVSSYRLRKSLRVLAVFLLSNAVYLFAYLLGKTAMYWHFNVHPYNYLLFSSGFLFGPALYFYTRAMVKKRELDIKTVALHLIPGALYILLIINLVFSAGNYEFKIPAPLSHWYTAVMHLQIMSYMIATLFLISSHQISIKKQFSALEKVDLNWLKINVIAFLLMWLVDFSHFILSLYGFIDHNWHQYLSFISILINFVFANLIIWVGLVTPDIFIELVEDTANEKPAGAIITSDLVNEIAVKLKEHMAKEKTYLEPEISLAELSVRTGINQRYLSYVINEHFEQNFYEFVNFYRIEAAKQILCSTEGKNKTILEILYECGFNSKSVFNTFFKKSTGLTPSQFKKQFSKAG